MTVDESETSGTSLDDAGREDLASRLGELLPTADSEAVRIVEELVKALESEACFIGGHLDGEGADLRAHDSAKCTDALRELQEKSKFEARFWARQVRLIDALAGP